MIWARRNCVLYGGIFNHPNQVVLEATELQTQFSRIVSRTTSVMGHSPFRSPMRWKSPLFGRYKANWDVALDSCAKHMGCGIVVRDHGGFVVAAQGRRIYGFPEPIHAEAMGALMAAELCRDLGLQDIILEGDSPLVIQALLSASPNWSSYGQIVADARSILYTRRSWVAGHVKREANSAAHLLAKNALLNLQDKIWIEEIPNCIISIVTLEQLALVS